MDLILASTSPYRRALLERLGVPFRCVAPRVDEEALKDPALAPRELAEHLARAKAASLEGEFPSSTIIGSDQLAAVDDRILGKPGTIEAAERQLATLAGGPHQLITALVVRHGGQTFAHTDVAVLYMRSLLPDEIRRYVAADRPVDCAGSYKLEARGVVLFDRIESADHSAITGLPLIALTSILRGLGYTIP